MRLKLRLPPQRGGTDDGALRQRVDRRPFRADEGVAHVLARQDRRDRQAVGQRRRHVLHGMHGEIDRAVEQRLLDLLGEQPLAARFAQRPVLDAVAGRFDDDDLESMPRHGHARRRDAAARHAAWARASAEPRVPMRSRDCCKGTSVDATGARSECGDSEARLQRQPQGIERTSKIDHTSKYTLASVPFDREVRSRSPQSVTNVAIGTLGAPRRQSMPARAARCKCFPQ